MSIELSDSYTTALNAATPPSGSRLTGTFKPLTTFSSSFGGAAAGNWTLLVADSTAGNVYELSSWGISFGF